MIAAIRQSGAHHAQTQHLQRKTYAQVAGLVKAKQSVAYTVKFEEEIKNELTTTWWRFSTTL